jgi:hypothetical protein
LALTSPTSGDISVGIVLLLAKAMGFSLVVLYNALSMAYLSFDLMALTANRYCHVCEILYNDES